MTNPIDRREHWTKVIEAVVVLAVAVACDLLLPPYEVPWLADIVNTLREPAIGVVVAIVVLLLAARLPQVFVVSLAIGVLIFGLIQVVQWRIAVDAGETARGAAEDWADVHLVDGESGSLSNEANALGQATFSWRGDDFDVRLDSQVGTSQHGLYWPAGNPEGSFFFAARTPLAVAAPYIACPLVFGIMNNRDYLMFYIERLDDNRFRAKIVQRWPTGNEWGFDGQDHLVSSPLPSVGKPDLFDWWHRSTVELSIAVEGAHYSFFVNDRLVLEQDLPDRPRTVAVGAVAVTNDAATDFTCSFSDVDLRTQ